MQHQAATACLLLLFTLQHRLYLLPRSSCILDSLQCSRHLAVTLLNTTRRSLLLVPLLLLRLLLLPAPLTPQRL
jgi:hypothetical protein